jgi:tryptophan synthase alpha chain
MVVGFGIGSRESAREVASLADGAVIGSALMKIVAAEGDTPQVAAKVGAFARELAAGVAEAATARPA